MRNSEIPAASMAWWKIRTAILTLVVLMIGNLAISLLFVCDLVADLRRKIGRGGAR